MGKAPILGSEAYHSCVALFWYKNYEDVMSDESIGESLGFFESLSNFFDNFDDEEDDT